MAKRKYYRKTGDKLSSRVKLGWLKFSFKTKKLLKTILLLSFVFCFLFFVFLVGVFAYFAKDLPNPEKLATRQITESTKIYDRTGTVLLYDIHGEEKRTIIPFEEIPKSVKEGTLVIEDVNFYSHFGLDFKGILRALLANLRGKKITQGGSTITQQFIKSSFLTPERTLTRKIKEAILAIELEMKYPKDKIFEFYLNQIPYGSNAYGIEATAQTFFNKPAKDLTLAEAAILASLPKAPSYYSPYGSHLDELKARQEYILDRMVRFGYITQKEAEKAKKEKLNFASVKTTIAAPHFVMYIREYLDEKYGQDYIEKAGLKVYTTLDWPLQQLAEQVVSEGVKKNEKKYQAYNAALVALDPKTGQILAMVGSKNYFANPLPQGCDPGKDCFFEPNVNVAIRDRQPGSSFKPFAYAVAFKKGYTPETILFDLKTEFNPSCPAEANSEFYLDNKCYHPQNYDGRFRGPVNLRQALAQSLNLPSVKVLYLSGVNQTINLSQDMGITTLKERSRYGLALVLGGGEVKLLDMTASYGVFANEGIRQPKTAILKIETSDGKILEEYQGKPVKILEPQIARTISDILSDNAARAPIFGSSSPLYLETMPAAVKTGTTQEYRDAWTIGYTPSLVAGVWAGNNNNRPMTKEGAGLYAAAPIWHEFMEKAYEIKTKNPRPRQGTDKTLSPFIQQTNEAESQQNLNEFTLPEQIEEFNKPEPIVANKSILNGQIFSEKIVKIDKISSKLATDLTPLDLVEEKKYQEVHTILYYLDKNNPKDAQPIDPFKDPQFLNWEKPILDWATEPKRLVEGYVFNRLPPTQYDDVHTLANQPEIKITSPENDSRLTGLLVKVDVQASALLGIKQIDFFFDDNFVGTDLLEPYELIFNLPNETKSGQYLIKTRVYDQALNRQEDEISITLDLPQ